MGRAWRWLLVGLAVVAVLAGAGWVGLGAATSRSQLARAIVWGESDTEDHRRFPARPVAAGPDWCQGPGGATPPWSRPDLGSGACRGLPVLVVGPGPAPATRLARLGRYGQHIYVVADSELVLVGFGRDAGYRSGPELLDELARRLDGVVTARS